MGDLVPGEGTCPWALGEVSVGLGQSSSCRGMDEYPGSRRACWRCIWTKPWT